MIKDTLTKTDYLYGILLDYFKGDHVKTNKWFKIKNPLLGNVSPLSMILVGRIDKLILFVEQQIEIDRCPSTHKKEIVNDEAYRA